MQYNYTVFGSIQPETPVFTFSQRLLCLHSARDSCVYIQPETLCLQVWVAQSKEVFLKQGLEERGRGERYQ